MRSVWYCSLNLRTIAIISYIVILHIILYANSISLTDFVYTQYWRKCRKSLHRIVLTIIYVTIVKCGINTDTQMCKFHIFIKQKQYFVRLTFALQYNTTFFVILVRSLHTRTVLCRSDFEFASLFALNFATLSTKTRLVAADVKLLSDGISGRVCQTSF